MPSGLLAHLFFPFDNSIAEGIRDDDRHAAVSRSVEVRTLIKKYEKDVTYDIAFIYAFRGEANRAFEWLETEPKDGGTFAEIVVDPLFGTLYGDPRWVPFLTELSTVAR